MDLNDNIRHTDEEIPNLYIDNYKNNFIYDKEALEYLRTSSFILKLIYQTIH